MPFDDVTLNIYDKPQDDRLVRRRELVAALYAQPENEPVMINGTMFCWDFSRFYEWRSRSCGYAGCAIGVMHLLWPDLVPPRLGQKNRYDLIKQVANTLGLSLEQVSLIFTQITAYTKPYGLCYGLADYEMVTSRMVAEKIQELGDVIYE